MATYSTSLKAKIEEVGRVRAVLQAGFRSHVNGKRYKLAMSPVTDPASACFNCPLNRHDPLSVERGCSSHWQHISDVQCHLVHQITTHQFAETISAQDILESL